MWRSLLERGVKVRLVLVATDSPEEVDTIQAILKEAGLEKAENWVFSDPFAERLRFEVNPRWRGELPLTYLQKADGTRELAVGQIPEKKLFRWFGWQQTEH